MMLKNATMENQATICPRIFIACFDSVDLTTQIFKLSHFQISYP